MNLFSKLRKPAWQSANGHKRAAAVGSDTDPALLEALPKLAVDDPEPEVRRQALRRCERGELFLRAAQHDADAGLRDWARQRWLQALQHGRSPLDDAAIAVLSRDERERLAAQMPSVDDRRRLLASIERPGFLAERVLADPDPSLRVELLERIDQIATLERIAERARKHDKRLARAARDRAESLQRSSGDNQAHRTQAEAVCTALERLLREVLAPTQRRERLLALQTEWNGLQREGFPDALLARYRGACEVIESQLAPPAPAAVVADTRSDTDTDTGSETVSSAPTPEQIAAEVRLQAELAAQAAERAREREVEQERQQARERARQEHEQRLAELATSLDAGDLGRARELAADLDPKLLGDAARRRWQQLQPQMKQLQGWEHWANNKVRARLCDDIEALIGSGLHPDALATKVREAQQQWRELDTLEGRSEQSEASGLDRRFRALCSRVLKPARGFFEKRDALRNERQQKIETFLDGAKADDEAIAFADLLTLQQQAVAHLRDLGLLTPPARKRLAGRLRALLDALKPRLDEGFAAIEQSRQRLIDLAQALANESDARRIGSEAKELNRRWKEIDKGRPGRDQAQWRQFRAALDAVFGGLDERRKERQADAEQRQDQARQLIDELQQLAALEGEALLASQARVRELADTWRSLGIRDTDLGEAWDSAVTRHRHALRDLDRDQQRERYRALADAASSPEGDGDEAVAEQAQHLIFEAEALAGLEGPADEREQRRHWQLQRLQQHLRGERSDGEQGLTEVLERWAALPGLSAEQRSRLRPRLYACIDAVLTR